MWSKLANFSKEKKLDILLICTYISTLNRKQQHLKKADDIVKI